MDEDELTQIRVLIEEQCQRIPDLARRLADDAQMDDADRYDALRNVSGSLQLILERLIRDGLADIGWGRLAAGLQDEIADAE